LVLIGSGVFFGVRYSIDRFSAEAQTGEGQTEGLVVEGLLKELEQERQQPRFVGELLGIFNRPSSDVPLPEGYQTYTDVCGSLPTVDVRRERAGALDLTLNLPPDYVLQADSMNTGVIACGDTVYAARWEYTHKASNGMTANIVIGRGIFRYEEYDVAASRVKTAVFAGREAVLIEPWTPDGLAQRSGVLFPEPFGVTFIHAADLPLDELLRLAEIVAEATK